MARDPAMVLSDLRVSDSCLFEELRHSISGIEHARFDGVGRNSNQVGDLWDRLFTQIEEIDNLSVRRRKFA